MTIAADSGKQTLEPAQQMTESANQVEGELAQLRAARAEVEKIRLGIQRELEVAKQLRAEAERYQRQIGTKARSEAQMLVLQTRMATKKEIEEIRRKAFEEIEQILHGMRVFRATAQEELEVQRKFTDAARIRSLSFSFQDKYDENSVSEEKEIGV